MVRTDNESLTVFRQRITYCPALLNRQRIVEIGVGPSSFSWDAGSLSRDTKFRAKLRHQVSRVHK